MEPVMKKNSNLLLLLMLFSSVSMAEDIKASLSWAGIQKVGFPVAGVVDYVIAKVGSKVNKGDVLAKLDAAPFSYHLQSCKAKIEKLQPVVFDAKIELDQAEELFERTVLSEVELSRIDGVYKTLKAEEAVLKAECKLKQWKADRAILKAQNSSYVMSSNVYPSMVISAENKSTAIIELVSATKALAVSFIGAKQLPQYKVGDDLKVVIDGQEIAATVESISLRGNTTNQYRLEAVFYYAQMVEPGKAVTLRF